MGMPRLHILLHHRTQLLQLLDLSSQALPFLDESVREVAVFEMLKESFLAPGFLLKKLKRLCSSRVSRHKVLQDRNLPMGLAS